MALALQAWQEYCRAVTLSIHPPRQVSSGKLEKNFCIHVEIAHMLLKAGANLDAICRARRYDLRFSHQGPPSVETPPCMVRKTSHPEATPFPTISWRYYSCSPDHPLQPSPAGVWWQAGIIGGVKRCSRRPEPDVRRERTLQSRMSHESPMLWSPKISIPAGERAQMTPPGRRASETSALPLSHGRIVEEAGRAHLTRADWLFLQALWRRSQAQSRGCELRPFPEWNFKRPKPRQVRLD